MPFCGLTAYDVFRGIILTLALGIHISSWRHFGIISASYKHAESQSLLYLSISLGRASSSSHWLHDKHQGLCLPLIFCREDGQRINKLPTLHPICRHWFFFRWTPPSSHPHPTPLFPQIVTLSWHPLTALVQALWQLDPLPFTHTPTPPCPLPAAPTFLCSVLFYKKYNPIDPKPDGKRWSVNRRVLNNRVPVL